VNVWFLSAPLAFVQPDRGSGAGVIARFDEAGRVEDDDAVVVLLRQREPARPVSVDQDPGGATVPRSETGRRVVGDTLRK
jgi:hypothetical protein